MAKKEITTKIKNNKTQNNAKADTKPLDFTSCKVPINKLRWECPTSIFNFKSTKELKPLNEIVGQERAIEGIKLGASIKAKGYNIFVTGLSGTGRLSTVQVILENTQHEKVELYDYCYVNNFKNDT
jgi:ATP-dependent Lon protease